MTDVRDTELARQRLNSRGMTLKKFLIFDDEQELDITNEVLAGARPGTDKGHLAQYAQDVEKAAVELASEVRMDPISFDAALQLAAKQVRLGHPIPVALREWVADILAGSTERPKQNGKHPGSTLCRDQLIAKLIKDIAKLANLKPTSGKRERGESACNAVADGFRLLRLQPDSYESMIKIWRRRKYLSTITFPESVRSSVYE